MAYALKVALYLNGAAAVVAMFGAKPEGKNNRCRIWLTVYIVRIHNCTLLIRLQVTGRGCEIEPACDSSWKPRYSVTWKLASHLFFIFPFF